MLQSWQNEAGRWVRRSGVFAAWCVGAVLCGGPAGAAEAPTASTSRETSSPKAGAVEFDLPAQSAASALLAFSKQTKIQVLFSFDDLRTVQSKAVTGRFEPLEALTKLLQGTGFKARANGPTRFVVAKADKPLGSLRGQFLSPDGTALAGIKVSIPFTRFSAITDDDGTFHFDALPPDNYRVVANLDGYESYHARSVQVAADNEVDLPPHTFQPMGNPARLAPFFVKESGTRRDPFDRSESLFAPRVAGGNLDLARTENDALPFNIFNRDQIARSGVVSLNEFLQRELLDADGGMQPPEQNGLEQTFTAGSTNLNLRGFGADQTIVLVNGRRLPEALISGSQSQTPDVNFIPLSLVQQVEVLPISAASLYSGNAVGGVINIVLRPGVDSEATEVALTYTNTMSGYDAPQSSASILHSRALLGGSLRVRFNASITRTTPPTEGELGFRQRHSTRAIANNLSLYRATPNVRGFQARAAEDGGAPPPQLPLFGPGTSTVTSVPPGADGTGGLAVFRGREGQRNYGFFNSPGGFATSPESIDFPYGRTQRRSAYFASIVFDATPWLQLGFDGTFTHSVMHRGYDVMGSDLRLREGSPYNPFGQEAIVSLNEMAPDLGENYSEARLEFGSGVLSALFFLPKNWRVLVDGQYGRNIAKYRGLVGADFNRWQELVDRGVYNPLRDTQVFGPPQEFYDRVLVYRGGVGRFVTLGDYSTLDGAIRATNHDLTLPTGRAVLNIGADYRQNTLGRYKDERVFADGTLATDPINYIGRTLERYSIFGEVQASLIPKKWLPRYIHSLDTDIAVRYIASNQEDETAVAPTFALKAQLPAGFTLRGSFSTSSRFPTPQMSRTTLPSGGSSVPIVSPDLKEVYDPLQAGTYHVQEESIVNPVLIAEETLTQTAGVVYRTGKKHRLRASLDFVDTRKVGEVVDLDAQDILNLEHLFPERVNREPIVPGDPLSGQVLSVVTGAINAEWRRSHHWSTSVDYAWTEFAGGTLEFYGRLLYFSKYQRLLIPGANTVDEINAPEGGSNGILKYRAKFGAGWSNRFHGFGIDGHYYHSRILPFKEHASQGSDHVAPYWQFDAFVQSELGRWIKWMPDGLRVQVRVNNLFAEPFPRYTNAGSGTGVQAYGDWRGRVFSLSVTSTF
ncbi:MAG: TonB-dependent receptor [Verrucomicrobiota bacterium]